MDIDQILEAIAGNRRALARTLTNIENGSITIHQIKQLYPRQKQTRALILGVRWQSPVPLELANLVLSTSYSNYGRKMETR